MSDKALRDQVIVFLQGKGAHIEFDDVFKNWPNAQRGVKAEGIPYSAWQILEHMRIAQWDILEFSRDAGHISPEFPQGYWPESGTPPDAAAWDNCIEQFYADLGEMEALVADPKTDLFAKIPHGTGQTIFREALLIADHNSYHLGQLVIIRRALGIW